MVVPLYVMNWRLAPWHLGEEPGVQDGVSIECIWMYSDCVSLSHCCHTQITPKGEHKLDIVIKYSNTKTGNGNISTFRKNLSNIAKRLLRSNEVFS